VTLSLKALRELTALLFAAALALPSAALGEETAETSVSESPEKKPRATASRALAVWGPSTAEAGGTITRNVLEARLPDSEPFPARVLRLSDWLEATAFEISGNSEAIPCSTWAPDIEVGDGKTEIGELTRRGLALLDDLEPASALESFALAEQRIPCQQVFLPREALARLPFHAGIAAYVNGDPSASTTYFKQAASIDPTQPWDPSYPTEPQATFLSAVQEVVSSPKARVYGDMRGTDYVEVWLDGQRLDLDKAIERAVLPGVHVVQALDRKSVWHSFVHRLDSGGKLFLFSASGLEQMVLDGPDGALAGVATAMLRDRASEEVLTELFIARVDPEDPGKTQVRTFDPRKSSWNTLEEPIAQAAPPAPPPVEKEPVPAVVTAPIEEEVEVPLSKKEQARKDLLRDPLFRSSAIVAMKLFQLRRCKPSEATNERCPGGSPETADYIGGLVQIDVRIIKGLNLDIRFGMTAADLRLGGTLLPEVGLGMRYRFLTGPLQPYLGVGADFFAGTTRESIYNSTNTVVIYAGALGTGGIDFEFSDGFRLSFEGGLGAIIQPEAGTEIWPMGHFVFGIGRFL